MRAADPWVVRAYANEDRTPVDDLLDENSDGLFVAQGHSLHGPAREGERWRRTLVAEVDEHVVGAVTIARNRVHPARYSQAVEVAASHRRRGLGRALINAVSQLRPEKRPFAGKVRSSDGPALSFLDKLGGRIIQTSPCPRPDPSSNVIKAWVDAQEVPAGVDLDTLSAVPDTERSALWARQYQWVHDNWMPVEPRALPDFAIRTVGIADTDLSVVACRGGQRVAVTWALREPNDSIVIVAETIERDLSDGQAIVAAALARCLQHLAVSALGDVVIDGHSTDPHLGPILAALPRAIPRDPIFLVEF